MPQYIVLAKFTDEGVKNMKEFPKQVEAADQKLKAAGLAIVDVDPKNAFTKDVGVTTAQGVPILFGYNVGTNIPEQVVYKMVSAIYKNRVQLAQADPGFTPMAKDFLGMQATGINANPHIPVHPGLAKFLKEHQIWNDKWTVATGGS